MRYTIDEIVKIIKDKRIIIYGAHLIAVEMYRIVKDYVSTNALLGFAVSSLSDNPDKLEGLKVSLIDEYEISDDIAVIVSLPKKYHCEIDESLRKRGYHTVILIDQECAEGIKREIILENVKEFGGHIGGYEIYEDDNDKSWLNLKAVTESVCSESDNDIHVKFPTLFYKEKEFLYDALKNTDVEGKIGTTFLGNNFFVSGKSTPSIESIDNVKVYMVYSQWDNGNRSGEQLPSWIVPIQAGASIATKIVGDIRDDSGDNVSFLNRTLAEMSVAYWIWKNDNDSLYKGLCHYRRHFVLTDSVISSMKENDVDVILTTPRFVPGGVKAMFVNETPVRETVFTNLERAIKDIYPDEIEAFDTYVNDVLYCPNNMVIARNDIYNTYCEWVFPVLFRLLEIEKDTTYGHDTDRHPAYAAELLTSYYFASRSGGMKMYFVDYEFL